MDYKIHLRQFEGPLDLLLHLTERAEIDIKDIFVSEITSQYLRYMDEIDDLDMDVASEFLATAATLLYIKSKTLLPRPPAAANDEDDDTEAEFIIRLQEYTQFKAISKRLSELHEEASLIISRNREEFPLPAPEIIWKTGSSDALYAAIKTLLARARNEDEGENRAHSVSYDEFTVEDMIKRLRAKLLNSKKIALEDCFNKGATKMEIIVTFMAMLAMAVHGELHFEQNRPYAPIMLYALDLKRYDLDYAGDYDEGVL